MKKRLQLFLIGGGVAVVIITVIIGVVVVILLSRSDTKDENLSRESSYVGQRKISLEDIGDFDENGDLVLNYTLENDFDVDDFDKFVGKWENPIPTIANYDEFSNKYDIPRVYTFDESVILSGEYSKRENSYGLVFVDDTSWAVSNDNSTGKSCEADDARCDAVRSDYIDSPYVQYKFYDQSDDEGEGTPDFQITYWRNFCNPEMDSENSNIRNMLITRALKGWGEEEDFYILGRYKLDISNSDSWKSGWLYMWALDLDGVVDSNTVFVYDFMLEDDYGRTYTHTVRAKREYLEENTQFIASLLSSAGVVERYTAVNEYACPYESKSHLRTRLEFYADEMTSICKSQTEPSCNSRYVVEESPNPQDKLYYIKQEYDKEDVAIDDGISGGRQIEVEICDSSNEDHVWGIMLDISSLTTIDLRSGSLSCKEYSTTLTSFESKFNIYTINPSTNTAIDLVFTEPLSDLFKDQNRVKVSINYNSSTDVEKNIEKW